MHRVDSLIAVNKYFAETMLEQIFFRHYFLLLNT